MFIHVAIQNFKMWLSHPELGIIAEQRAICTIVCYPVSFIAFVTRIAPADLDGMILEYAPCDSCT